MCSAFGNKKLLVIFRAQNANWGRKCAAFAIADSFMKM
jgi:hypothetical protein